MPTRIINFHMRFICARVSFSFLAKGEQNEIVWIIGGGGGGKHLFMCKACGKLGGPGECFPRENLILDFLLDTIWWNLGRFSHKP